MKYNVNPGMLGAKSLIKEIEDTLFTEEVTIEHRSQVSVVVGVHPNDTLTLVDLLNKHGLLLYSLPKEDA